MALLSFSEALLEAQNYNRRHVLLGNGFSIACRPKIFAYGKLFEQADFSKIPQQRRTLSRRSARKTSRRSLKPCETRQPSSLHMVGRQNWRSLSLPMQMDCENFWFKQSRPLILLGQVIYLTKSTNHAVNS